VTLKGRVACEVNTTDELLLTEMVLEGVFEGLTPQEAAALLSGLVFQGSTDAAPGPLPPSLLVAQERAGEIAHAVAVVQRACGLDVVPREYVSAALHWGLMEVVFHWARGVPFAAICELTDVEEGTIVRCVTRLDEACREVRNAARVMGDPHLFQLMEAASAAIKRDVVFASSLYIV
jgi:antiviral helicase SKI2